LDFNTVPKKGHFRLLAESCTCEKERKVLFYLSSKEGASTLRTLQKQSNPTFLEVWCAFPSCQLTLEQLIFALPLLQQRYYSLASSPLASRFEFNVALTVVDYETSFGARRLGVCSTYLDRLVSTTPNLDKCAAEPEWVQCKQSVPLTISFRTLPTSLIFRPPSDTRVPMIMLSAGTGITPFVGFLEHRLQQVKQGIVESNAIGDMLVLHGCRHPEHDQIYRWLEPFNKKELLPVEYDVAYSQHATGNEGVRYVQDLIPLHAKRIYELLTTYNGLVFVCGYET
jgi:sulfite reductase alpha subunit-like flavoprotein